MLGVCWPAGYSELVFWNKETTMKAKILGLLVLAVALILGGCSSSADYAYVIDQQKLEKQEIRPG